MYSDIVEILLMNREIFFSHQPISLLQWEKVAGKFLFLPPPPPLTWLAGTRGSEAPVKIKSLDCLEN
jgi:hypothetical protein